MKKILYALLVVCFWTAATVSYLLASTASQNLAWTAPVTNTNGSIFCSYTGQTGCTTLDLAAYTIYWGPINPPTNKLVIPITAANALLNMTYTVNNLPPNTVEYYYVTATDIYSTESASSNQITALTPKPAPAVAISNFAPSTAVIH